MLRQNPAEFEASLFARRKNQDGRNKNSKRIITMKNSVLKNFAAAVVILVCGIAGFGQIAKRIDFAKEGSNALVWEERVAANKSKSFVFSARKGQVLKLGFVDDTKQGSMDLGKISIEPNTDELFEMPIEVTKDYTFSVSNNSNKMTSFRITISLENSVAPARMTTASSSNPNTVRVQFARGETSTSMTKDIPANNSVNFIIGMKKGQKMNFTVGYDFKDDDIYTALYEPNTKDVTLSSGPKEPQEFDVKMSGDHRLTVTNSTGKKVTITLYLDIE